MTERKEKGLDELRAEIRVVEERINGVREGKKQLPGLRHFKWERNVETGGFELVPLGEASRRFETMFFAKSEGAKGYIQSNHQLLELVAQFAILLKKYKEYAARIGAPVSGESVESRLAGIEATLEQWPEWSGEVESRLDELEKALREEGEEEPEPEEPAKKPTEKEDVKKDKIIVAEI